jgi:hypothetical protein
MKTFIIIAAVALSAAACRSSKSSGENPALRLERDYAEKSEAHAQDLYRTGQAPSLSEARAQAAGEANAEWAAAAKTVERKQKQEKFEKDLSKINRDGK